VAAGFARIFCGVMGEKGRRKRGKFCMCLIFMWEVSEGCGGVKKSWFGEEKFVMICMVGVRIFA
jgi:hypothetical protein